MTGSIHLYALLADRHVDLSGWSGLDGSAVELLPLDGHDLVALVGRLEGPAAPTIEHVRQHARIVERAFACAPVLPARFGTGAADEVALRHTLSSRLASLASHLATLDGQAEIGLRIVLPEDHRSARPTVPPLGSAHSGHDYLRGRLSERNRRSATEALLRPWIEPIEAVMRAWAARWTACPSRDDGTVAATAYLGRRDGIPQLRTALPSTVHEPTGARALVGGPWPPWSFADPLPAAATAMARAA